MIEAHLGIGLEFAGEVEAVGEGVTSLSVGDRVLGLGIGCFGTRAVITGEHLRRAKSRQTCRSRQAATVPLAYHDGVVRAAETSGNFSAGERVLVHAAAGGVGMAAVQLCRHFGAEVYGTASAGKWSVLEGMGLDARHIASSRDAELRDEIPVGNGWRGSGCRPQLADG